MVKSKGNIDENENTSKYSVNAHQSWFAIKTNIALSISLYDISSIFKNKRDDDVECYYYVTWNPRIQRDDSVMLSTRYDINNRFLSN